MTTTVMARRLIDLDADKAKYRIQGISGTATAGATTDIDWKFPEERWMHGASFLCKDHVFGDKATVQVVDKDNVLGFGAGVVVDTFAEDFYVAEDQQNQGQITCNYIALVPANLYLRVKYTSVGGANVGVKLNLFTHIPRL